MKKLLLLSLAILFANQVNSQNPWQPLDNGTDGVVNDLIVFNNELYAAGQFSIVGGMVRPNIAKWNGSNWATVGGATSILNKQAKKMIIYNNELYVFGEFNSVGTSTVYAAAKWNGSALVSVGFPGVPNYNSIINSAAVYNGKLIVTHNGKIYSYNGSTWTIVGNGGYSTSQGTGGLCVYNNELYAYGNCTTTGVSTFTSGISKWNGTTWSDVGGLVTFPVAIYAMAVHNNELYVGGQFSNIGGVAVTNFAKYNGVNWSVANTGAQFQTNVYSILSYSNNLYVGTCVFDYTLQKFQSPFIKNGNTTYTTVSASGDLIYPNGCPGIFALCFYNNQLHVGGAINNPFNSPVPYPSIMSVARLSSFVGIKENFIKSPLNISPNPSTGQFTFEGISENFSIEITDLAGRIIYTGQLDESKNSINLQDKTSGVYFYKIRNKENKVQQGKLILE